MMWMFHRHAGNNCSDKTGGDMYTQGICKYSRSSKSFKHLKKHPNHEYQGINVICLLLPVPWLCHFDNRKLVVCYSSPVGWVDIQDGLRTGLSVESRTKLSTHWASRQWYICKDWIHRVQRTSLELFFEKGCMMLHTWQVMHLTSCLSMVLS